MKKNGYDLTLVHFSTVHPRTDIRILVKQCHSLVAHRADRVKLFVQDGRGPAEVEGIQVVDTGPRSGVRVLRATVGAWRMWRAVRAARPALAHFHDPELIPVGLALKISAVKVIYDVHEDVPRQILRKQWIPTLVRRPVAVMVALAEWAASRLLDGIVPATPQIAERFPEAKTVVVQNFPRLDELVPLKPIAYGERPPAFAYVGGITADRGIIEMLEAFDRLPQAVGAQFELAGMFTPPTLQELAASLPGWHSVRYHGWASREAVAEFLGRSRAGFVVLHPNGRYEHAYPIKMFEYMAASLPVIASDFPLWRQIIDGSGCGLLVDPLDPQAIAEAMQWVLAHPAEAERMGQRGREAVLEKYNWATEAAKLVTLYDRLLER